MKNIIIILFLALIISSCTCNCNKKRFASKANAKTEQNSNYKQFVNKRYNADFNFFPSKNNDYVLCINQKKTDNLNPFPPLQFCIFSIVENNIIYEQILENGNVEWIDDYKLKITNVPTQIKKNENPEKVRIINVKLLKDK